MTHRTWKGLIMSTPTRARGRGLAMGLAVAFAVLWPVLASPPALADTAPASTRVSMKDFAFSPATVTVTAGTAVTWTYDESATDPQPNCESPYFQPPSPVACGGHSTTASDNGGDGKPLWDSGVHRADGFPFSHVFTKPGTYHYYCLLHGGPHPNNPATHMEGDVIVVAARGGGGGGSGPGSTPGPTSPQSAVNAATATALPNTSNATASGAAGLGALLASALLLAGPARRRRR
jgi:plastocyanin